MGDTSTVYHTAQGLTLEANSSPIENSLSVVPRRSGKIGITTDNKIASTNNPEDTISRHLDFDPRHDVILLREPTPTARVYLRFSSTQRYAVLHNRDNPGVTLGWLRGRQRPVCLFVCDIRAIKAALLDFTKSSLSDRLLSRVGAVLLVPPSRVVPLRVYPLDIWNQTGGNGQRSHAGLTEP